MPNTELVDSERSDRRGSGQGPFLPRPVLLMIYVVAAALAVVGVAGLLLPAVPGIILLFFAGALAITPTLIDRDRSAANDGRPSSPSRR